MWRFVRSSSLYRKNVSEDVESKRASRLCELLPECVLDQIFYFLVDEADIASLSCCGRVLSERGNDQIVWSEVARLGFTKARGGTELARHDPSGQSVDSYRFKRARHVETWPATLTTWKAHSDVSITQVADGLVDVSCNVRCKLRSNRCVAGDAPFSILSESPIPGVRRDGTKIWRLAAGAYFEVTLKLTKHSKTIDSKEFGTKAASAARPCVAVGLCTSSFCLRGKQPGWDKSSWAVHADDGLRFHGRGVGAPYGPAFLAGDVVGCGVFKEEDNDSAFVFYTLNGKLVDEETRAFTLAPEVTNDLYPVVGMDTNRIACRVNLGTYEPFEFDLDEFLLSLRPSTVDAAPKIARTKLTLTTRKSPRRNNLLSGRRLNLRSRFGFADLASFVARAEEVFLDVEQQLQGQEEEEAEVEEEEDDFYFEDEEEEEEYAATLLQVPAAAVSVS